MRLERIIAIAGLPEGQVFSPAELDRAADRLRRSGVFQSVALTEADRVRMPDLLDIDATVVDLDGGPDTWWLRRPPHEHPVHDEGPGH